MLGLLWSLIRGALLLLGHLSGGGSFPKPLSRQEEAQALAAMQAGDESARARLIEHNLRLVAHVVRKYTVPGLTLNFSDSQSLVQGVIMGEVLRRPEFKNGRRVIH